MSTVIQKETIGVNLYAPDGYMQVESYSYGSVSGMTVGQLVMAVCCHRAAVIEASSVIKMNQVTGQSDALEQLSLSAREVVDGTLTEATKALMRTYCEVEESEFAVDTFDRRINLFNKLKVAMDNLSSQVQKDTVKLQSLVSRRDVAFNTSAAIVQSLGRAGQTMAAVL